MLIKTRDIGIESNVRFDSEEGILELAASMRSIGQITPIAVKVMDDGKYVVVAGHRRLAAAERLKWEEIEAFVLNGEAADNTMVIQAAENIARMELTPYEVSQAMLDLQVLGMKQADIAEAVGLNKSMVSKYQKIAKGTVGVDPVRLNQMGFHDLEAFEDAHSMPDEIRSQMVDTIEADPNATYWAINDALRAQDKWRWEHKKDNAARIQMYLDQGAVPMEGGERQDAKALYGEAIDAHLGQPCHGIETQRSWSTDGGYEIAHYCLDPTSHAGDKIKALHDVAVEAKEKGITGTVRMRSEATIKKHRKQAMKDAVVAFAKEPKMRVLTEMMVLVLRDSQRQYKWQELGKAFGLEKPKDQFHFEWDDYLSGFNDKDKATQILILCVGSYYISLLGHYGDSIAAREKLDELFGYVDPHPGEGESTSYHMEEE